SPEWLNSRHKKTGARLPFFMVASDCLFGSGRGFHDQVTRFFGVAPTLNFYPFTFFEVFVVLEEVFDLLAQQFRYIVDVVYIVVQLGQLLVRYGQQFSVATGFVFHVQHAHGAGTDNRTRLHRIRRDCASVHRVTVAGKRVGDVAVVGRVEHRGSHKTVNQQAVHFFVDFVLDRRVVGRDFNGHVEILGQVLTGRNGVIAHRSFLSEWVIKKNRRRL